MKKRTLLLIVGLFVVVMAGSRILWIQTFSVPEQPHAKAGLLDLRHWDASDGRTITLDGQWEFYPNVWLIHKEQPRSDAAAAGSLLHVPGSWNTALRPGDGTPFGYGSYRLRILVDPSRDPTYSIRIPSVRSSSELFVNGRSLAKSGQPAEPENGYVPRNVPYSASFAANGSSVIEVVVQAANFTDSRDSGIVRSIKFGTEEAIAREKDLSVAMQQIVAVALLFHALYAFILYTMGYRDRKLVYFSLLVLCAILSILIGGEDKILLYWLPIDLEISLDAVAILGIAGLYALLQCFKDRLPAFWRTTVIPVFAAVCGAAVIAVLLLPARQTQSLNNLFMIFGFLVIFLAILSMFRTSVKEIKDNVLTLLSFIALSSNFTWWAVQMGAGIKVVYYPFDLIIAMFLFATVWFRQYLRVHAEARELAARLQKANKRKDEFLANTSHELRNPLHGILNISQAVLEREQASLSDRSVKDLETVLSVGRRMKLMLNDLLDAMKLKESRPRLHLTGFSLYATATGLLTLLQMMTEERPLRLVNRIPENFPPVFADENRIVQVLFNLLHNALKYTMEGEVSIRAHVGGGKAYIVVADTGIGMDEETARRVFEPYEQAPLDATMIEGGFGLGLSISKELVSLHGSVLEVKSAPGSGTEFSFALPLFAASTVSADAEAAVSAESAGHVSMSMAAQALAAAPDSPASGSAASALAAPFDLANAEVAATTDEAEPAGSVPPRQPILTDRPRLLVVDDDPLNLKVLENILRPERYDILAVTDGRKALAALDSKEWDLVIADVMMPMMSGLELARTIRARFSITELPILLLTARSRLSDIENGFLAGANDYVTKPVEALELRSRVQALTEVRKSARDRLQMEAAWLQAQIQPHFLFNTLNTVAALSELDTDRMRKVLEHFGNFLKEKFKFQNIEALVPIEYELNLVRSYLYIEQQRFGERLHVIWEADEYGPMSIPPLTLQPLVENAIKHGVMKRSRGGSIRIRLTDYGTHAEIAVTDDGVGMDAEEWMRKLAGRASSASGIGLPNTDLRLKRHFGSGLQIGSRPGEGTTLSFVIRRTTGMPAEQNRA